MATISQSNTGIFEYLKVKAFLYKYNPPFTATGTVNSGLAEIATYSLPLEEQYFSKYDISNFVSSYTFDQTIDGNTFSWSLTLEDHIIVQPDLVRVLNADVTNQPILNNSVSLPVTTPPQEDVPGAASGLVNISNYEVMTPTPYEKSVGINPASIVEAAKLERGNAEPELVSKLGGGQTVQGIRLSDLIQKYDIVSLFLYKETSPLEELKGNKVLFATLNSDTGQPIQFFRFVPSSIGTGQPLSASDLQHETILLSPFPNNPSKTIFSNEFNGFVMTKTFTRDISGVDQVSINGNGITRLFGATRRIVKPSLFQNAIYGTLANQNVQTVSANQTVFAGKALGEIVADLFSFAYNIDFNLSTSSDLLTVTNVSFDYFDISALQLLNVRNASLFTVPPYLLALVMKRRLFNFRQIPAQFVNSVNNNLPIFTIDELVPFLNAGVSSQIEYFEGISPVQFDPTVLSLQTYFRFLAAVYEFFNPKLSTPFEILDDIRKVTFAEIFESPTGVISIRNPQYNNTDLVHFSSDLNILNSSYTETVNDLVSLMKLGYSVDYIPLISPSQEFAFIDGKFIKQFGFLESSVDANPNAKDDANSNNSNNQTQHAILFRYAEFFLRYHNAKLNTGTIVADLDNTVHIGDTYYDTKNNKFGYIVGLSKNVGPGQPATMTLSLSFVRDAYNIDPTTKEGANLIFSILPTLEFINGNQGADGPSTQTLQEALINTSPLPTI